MCIWVTILKFTNIMFVYGRQKLNTVSDGPKLRLIVKCWTFNWYRILFKPYIHFI